MPNQLSTSSEQDAEKVVQDIIDEAKKNTITLDAPAQPVDAGAVTEGVPTVDEGSMVEPAADVDAAASQ